MKYFGVLISFIFLFSLVSGNSFAEDKVNKPEGQAAAENSSQNEKSEHQDKETIASQKEVANKMAEAWCAKMLECDQKNEMGSKECLKVLKDSFEKGFAKPAGGKKVEVSKQKLEQCSDSIKKDTCDALRTAQKLPGCGFISMLNRY